MGVQELALWVAGFAAPTGFAADHVSRPQLARIAYSVAAVAGAAYAVSWDIDTARPILFRLAWTGLVGAVDGGLFVLAIADTFGVFRKDRVVSANAESDSTDHHA